MAVATLPRVQVNPAWALDPSLVLYLPLRYLDGASFADRSAYGRLCTKTGAFWTPQGHSFDGTDDRIVIPDHSSLDLTTTFTLVGNVKKPDMATTGYLVARNGTASNDAQYSIYINTNGSVEGYFDSTVWSSMLPAGTITAGDWANVAVTYNNATIKAFHNGLTLNTKAQAGPFTSRGYTTLVGARNNAGATFAVFLRGLADDVRIYSRALTPQEIQRMYIETKGCHT